MDVDGTPPVDILLSHGGPGTPSDFAELRRLLSAWLAKRFAARAVEAQVAFLENCGHVLGHDQPRAFERWLDEDLRACELR